MRLCKIALSRLLSENRSMGFHIDPISSMKHIRETNFAFSKRSLQSKKQILFHMFWALYDISLKRDFRPIYIEKQPIWATKPVYGIFHRPNIINETHVFSYVSSTPKHIFWNVISGHYILKNSPFEALNSRRRILRLAISLRKHMLFHMFQAHRCISLNKLKLFLI